MAILPPTYDVCDESRLYDAQSGYQYNLPQKLLQEFRRGIGFGRKEEYSPDEKARVDADARAIFAKIMGQKPVKEPVAVITCGSPGAGKTVLLHALMKHGRSYAYIDPDDVCLKNMEQTYEKELSQLGQKSAYDKWRPASNAIHHLALGNLIRDKYGLYVGTTATSDQTWRLFDFLKKNNYQIRLIHVSASDETRWKSIQERDKSFVQTTEEDIRDKGKLFFERIQDTYLKYADAIDFYYRDNSTSKAVHAASWVRASSELTVKDPRSYEKIVLLHNTACKAMGNHALLWENTVDKASKAK